MRARDHDKGQRDAEHDEAVRARTARAREVERAMLRLGHSLAGAGYGVLMWERPWSTADGEETGAEG